MSAFDDWIKKEVGYYTENSYAAYEIVWNAAIKSMEADELSHNNGKGEICSDNPCDYCNKEGNCTITKPCHDQFSGRKLHTC